MTGERKYKTLLADDVAGLRRLVGLAIESSGRFEVVAQAGTGAEAIEKAAAIQPDLVLLDLSMPEMDGLEALPRILKVAPNTRVVVLSGFNHIRMAPVAKRLGASAYLEKGMEPERMAEALLEVLEPDAGRSKVAYPDIVPPGGMHSPSAGEAEDAPSFRVLVLESDDERRARVVSLLGAANPACFRPSAVGSLADAVTRLEEDGADLALIDPTGLPLSPEDSLVEILSRAQRIPVVALLRSPDDKLAAAGIRLGIEDCLPQDGLEPGILTRSLLYAVERRRAHEARRSLRDQESALRRMREMESLKNEFFNAAAHELGTPLTPIQLQVALLKSLRRTSTDPAEQRAIDILERNVDRLLHLNQDILDVARLQSGHLSVSKKSVELKRLVTEVSDTFAPLAQAAGIHLETSCPPDVAAEADAQRLGQVLFNLVKNALKFTPRDGRVSIDVKAGPKEVEVEVRDTGIGLTKEQIGRLFQPFSQVLGAAQPAGIGSGLGLFVSRGIIELHGGRIWCESDGPGRGAAFCFVVPRASVPPKPSAGHRSLLAPAG